ncbi:MAG: hypothetical protein WBV91_07375 [Desulfobacterales bacterium]
MRHTLMVSPFSIRNVRLFILIVMTVPAFIGLAVVLVYVVWTFRRTGAAERPS